MPISENILKEIDNTDADNRLKELMKNLLILEDDGARRWKNQYEEMVKDHLELSKEEDN